MKAADSQFTQTSAARRSSLELAVVNIETLSAIGRQAQEQQMSSAACRLKTLLTLITFSSAVADFRGTFQRHIVHRGFVAFILAIPVLLCACLADSTRLSGSQYMLPQAAGAALGMTRRQLERARPKVFDNSGRLEEHAETTITSYEFSTDGDTANVTGGASRGYVARVTLDDFNLPTSESEYAARVQSIRDRWEEIGGPPAETMGESTTIGPAPGMQYTVLTWHEADATLKLFFVSDVTRLDATGPYLRAVVQARR